MHPPDLFKSHNTQLLFQFISRLLKRSPKSIKFTDGTCDASRWFEAQGGGGEQCRTKSLFFLVELFLQLFLLLQQRVELLLQLAVLVVQTLPVRSGVE